MNRRNLLQGGVFLLAPDANTHTDELTRKSVFDDEIIRIMTLVKDIRSGDLRGSLSRDWSLDGGLQVSSPVRYLLRSCRNIKIDVDFRLVDVERPFDNPYDIITSVSDAYLHYPYYD